MGGAVNAIGNVTPFAEFNISADPAAIVITISLTNPQFTTTLLETLPALNPAKATLLPLDNTRQYRFTEDGWEDSCQALGLQIGFGTYVQ